VGSVFTLGAFTQGALKLGALQWPPFFQPAEPSVDSHVLCRLKTCTHFFAEAGRRVAEVAAGFQPAEFPLVRRAARACP